MDTSPAAQSPNMIGMEKPKSASAATVILWITFVLSLIIMVYFFVANYSLANLTTERESSISDLDSKLASPTYTEAETQALSFKEAFSALSGLSANRKSKSEVFADLYGHFTKDVKIRNVAVSDEGKLSIDGSTASYRAVADFSTGLKAYDKISDLKLGSAALDPAEGVADNQKITFTVTAVLNMEKDTTSTDTDSADTTESVTPAEAE